MNYYVIGEREIVLAFALAGVEGSVAETRDEALAAFERVTGKSGASRGGGGAGDIPRVLILTEGAAHLIQDEELAWQKAGNYPLIVEVPGLDGHLAGRKTLSESIAEAVGLRV